MLNPNTKLNLTLAATATAVGAIVWATFYAANLINDFRGDLAEVSRQLSEYRVDTFTKSNAAEVTLRNAILNPGTHWADPRDPTKTIWVDASRWSKPKD